MYNLDNIVRIYFSSVSAQMIIKNKINYKKFSADEFSRLAKAYIQQYSETESQQLYEYIKDIPTAYDVEKVVEQLEEKRNKMYRADRSLMSARTNISIDKAIEIIKSGGIE